VVYWKFLLVGAVSPFTGYAWQPGQWVSVDESHECKAGFHACRIADLPYWLNAELWEFELAAPAVQTASKVVSTRALAVAQVREWDAEAAAELALACARRTARHAADELSEACLGNEARQLAEITAAAPPGEWFDVAERCAAMASARGARQASKLCGYVQDSVEALGIYPVASSAYIAARAANQRSSASEADPYLAERAWQADWLVRRLRLNASAS
jgi:hypothetical protein